MLTEPTFDKDGYPTDETLATITKWDIDDDLSEFLDLMQFVHDAWRWPDWGWKEEDVVDDRGRRHREYHISTGGWSGNESLIGALHQNWLFNAIAAESWRRGGHYVYRIPLKKEEARAFDQDAT